MSPSRTISQLFQGADNVGGARGLVWEACSQLCDWKVFQGTNHSCIYGELLLQQVNELEDGGNEEFVPYLLLWGWAKYLTDCELLLTAGQNTNCTEVLRELCWYWEIEMPTTNVLVNSCLLLESKLKQAVTGVGPWQDVIRNASEVVLHEWTHRTLHDKFVVHILNEKPFDA